VTRTGKNPWPSPQKSDDQPEGHHRQPDAAEIPGHALCLDIPAEPGRNRTTIRITGIVQPSPQKKKSN
jgi:hypothetical protein